MINVIWVIVMVSGGDSSTSLPQTRYSTEKACMETVEKMLVGTWYRNYSNTKVTAQTTPNPTLYATCIPTEEK